MRIVPPRQARRPVEVLLRRKPTPSTRCRLGEPLPCVAYVPASVAVSNAPDAADATTAVLDLPEADIDSDPFPPGSTCEMPRRRRGSSCAARRRQGGRLKVTEDLAVEQSALAGKRR